MYFFWGYFHIFNMKAIHHYRCCGLQPGVLGSNSSQENDVMHFLTEPAPQCVLFLNVCMYVCEWTATMNEHK